MKPGVGSFHSWSPCILHSLQNLLQQFYQKRKIFVAISFSFKGGSPLDLLKFYNFSSPFVRTLRSAARQSLHGFQKFMFFYAQNLQTRLAILFLTNCH